MMMVMMTPTKSPLSKEFDFYRAHQDEMVAKYEGKFVVIKNGAVLGAYDDELSAVNATKREHELGTFLVQKVTKGADAYTQTFHSRVVFT